MADRLLFLLGLALGTVCPAAPATGLPLAHDTVALRLVLNLPAYRLEALEGDSLAATLRVAIGSREYPTPTGRFTVTRITWNPWWYPPARDWARNDTITPPCPTNPMGVVKLGFGDGFFIHGTPAPSSIGSAASHGCVRTANSDAQALAELIVRHAHPDALPAVRGWASAATTRVLALRHGVALEIRYDLAEVRGDSLLLYPDVYARAPATAARVRLALTALAAGGVNVQRIDRFVLGRAIATSRRGRVAVAIVDLLEPPLVVTGPVIPATGGIP